MLLEAQADVNGVQAGRIGLFRLHQEARQWLRL